MVLIILFLFIQSYISLICVNVHFADLQDGISDQEENDDDANYDDESVPSIRHDQDTNDEEDYYDDDNVPDIVNLEINRVAGANDAYYNSGSVSF